MKNKMIAISLLLSFLLVLSHEMISHHHHDTVANNLFINLDQNDENNHHSNDKRPHRHNSPDEKNKESDSDQDHNHPFPLHDHVSAAEDFNCTRANILESNTNIPNVKIFAVLCVFLKEYSEPQNFTNYSFGEPPFLINSLFEPGAIALRGPPSIV